MRVLGARNAIATKDNNNNASKDPTPKKKRTPNRRMTVVAPKQPHKSENVRVLVRQRPMTLDELKRGGAEAVRIIGDKEVVLGHEPAYSSHEPPTSVGRQLAARVASSAALSPPPPPPLEGTPEHWEELASPYGTTPPPTTPQHQATASAPHHPPMRFAFDRVFGPNATTEQVYKAGEVDEIVRGFFDGYHGTVLTYGQTGSGKVRGTHERDALATTGRPTESSFRPSLTRTHSRARSLFPSSLSLPLSPSLSLSFILLLRRTRWKVYWVSPRVTCSAGSTRARGATAFCFGRPSSRSTTKASRTSSCRRGGPAREPPSPCVCARRGQVRGLAQMRAWGWWWTV